jgi:hypothetical protein
MLASLLHLELILDEPFLKLLLAQSVVVVAIL